MTSSEHQSPPHHSPRYKRKVAGGLILAAAAGLTAAAQDLPPLGTESEEPETAVSEEVPARARRAPAPVANPPVANPPVANPPVASTQSGGVQYAPQACPPDRPGPIRRWHERCKANYRDKIWGYPEEFMDAPLGAMLEGHLAAQISNGRAARMVLYQYDFVPGTDRLKPRGRVQMAKFIPWLSAYGIIVEPSGAGPVLDEARRQTVLRELAGDEFRYPGAQVAIGRPLRRGILGGDGTVVDRNLTSMTTARGVGSSGPTSGSAAGTSSGGGGSQSSSSSTGAGGR